MSFRILERIQPRSWPRRWHRPASLLSRILRPIFVAWMHRKRKKILLAPQVQTKVPVVCVGNLVIGGSGKSPLVGSLALALKEAGFKPGIISGGYGGQLTSLPVEVGSNALPQHVGDEPVMLRRQTECPVVVGHDRSRAVERLSFHHDVDIILADDGLQNASLWRDLSVVIFNTNQGIGNGLELPFGPLREPLSVLDDMDAIVMRETTCPLKELIKLGIHTNTEVFKSESFMSYVYRSDEPEIHYELEHLAPMGNFDAIAGIASPERFFKGLLDAGLVFCKHIFRDHHQYRLADLEDKSTIITTEKDAVKLIHFVNQPFWVVVLESKQPELETWLIDQLTNWSNK